MAFRRLAILFTLLIVSRCAFSAPQLPCQSAAEYRALLDYVTQRSGDPAASLPALTDAIPQECIFTDAGHPFRISNLELQKSLRQIANESDVDARGGDLKALQDRLRQRSLRLDGYEQSVDPTAKPKLQQILQRREFRRVGAQDASAILKEWAMRFLTQLFSKIGKDPRPFLLGVKIVVYSVCVLVGGLILWKLYRWAMREAPPEAVREVIPFAPSARNWRVWLSDARAAAAKGELREAVHSSYWAAISYLESKGTWRPDRARTPREYLRLIAQTSPTRPLLADITREFEVIWYGNHSPSVDECESFLAKVEQIGCR